MFVVGGESLIDLVAEPRGADGALRLMAHQGGSPYNCAIALSKLGNATGFLCPISKDSLGGFLLEPLAVAGVVPLLNQRVTAPTTLAVATLNERMEARYEFYRGADRALNTSALIDALPAAIALYQIGGFCAIEPEDAIIWLDVVDEAIKRGATISIDPNVRPSLVGDFDTYRARLSSFLDRAHLIKISEEDLKALDPALTVEAHAADLLARPNCELVIITLGDKGSMAFTATAQARAEIWSPPVFGDTVGAGDSLMAGVLTILGERDDLRPGRLKALDKQALDEVLHFGAVVAGLNCAHKGCVPPTRSEVDAAL